MSFSKNIQQGSFWINVLKISVPFLIFVTIFSLLVNSGSALFSGDFETVNNINFSEGKWQRFWLTKVTVSVLYAIYVVNKKTK
ncbi:hypothetical protein G1J88_00625 [Tenacibaculum dicentrarchi]|uniref:hypothetical protein n=1 Tax=Tenacibaculum dicentrarchi TaxID=669041 RepID=UPI000C79681C|nr:hypothetical protein [Tenacibaculum dicentrarchi]MCD8418981.1 hypothetical protein [Tenacibaculum dicentrarchi]MCD8436685.1 hypothetical protein [Tenacibaculum dicentrarchi]MCG8826887.1 hypothetical protein [Tenacibaculum dicentrarchi]SOU86981.1 conserved hypothetical protein [Tenacibaculum dicentrarchi]